ncbi:MAG: adenylyltransferase/cytidyltransferase family protein [Patescibacteria group bacterium]
MIIKIDKAIEISNKLRKQRKSIVVAGGCFDILHVGHVRFLKNAKDQGEVLFILLENDEKVRKLKGKNRPINSQKDRAEILASLKYVDYVVLLPYMKSDEDYDKLINQIKPNVLATTENDPAIIHKKRQAKLINAEIKEVVERIKEKSTTILGKIILKKNK